MPQWERQRILIIGMTYPSYSRKYRENVCTGAFLEGTHEMVRIHPVPRRYMEVGRQFRAFQWVEASLAPHDGDGRPESYRIEPSSIRLCETMPLEQRQEFIEKSPHLVRSVEALHERWTTDRTSLGVIVPNEITRLHLRARSSSERTEWAEIEKAVRATDDMFTGRPRKIDFPEWRFMVDFRCDDTRCSGHVMGLSEWGIHELYRKVRGDRNWKEKVLDAMRRRLNSRRKCFLYLGNYRKRLDNFGLMSSSEFKIEPQLKLF